MIYIDMDMPTCCNRCFALDDSGDYPYCLISCKSRGYTFNTRSERMPDCPLKEVNKDSIFGRWIKISGYCTAGGDPVYACSNCGGSEHVYGIEHRKRKTVCDNCGSINIYPYEERVKEEEDEQ